MTNRVLLANFSDYFFQRTHTAANFSHTGAHEIFISCRCANDYFIKFLHSLGYFFSHKWILK